MSKRDDGGPAFPRPAHTTDRAVDWVEVSCELVGMSLRDWFAGRAMQGLIHDILIDQHWEDVLMGQGMTEKEFPTFLAHLSYLAADAMLAQRAK
jgi:hypothetical protein